jgi:16S rRNA (guanine966-N2)-methyltransferase
MRVIAGTAKRIPLASPPGLTTRPTTDRIKETLFNMLQNEVYDAHFLDLFSGSGGIGIEALSRGAASCIFVEQDKKALACIDENLKKTGLELKAKVLPMDAIKALAYLEKTKTFDLIFMDPPYGKEYEKRVLSYLKNSRLLTQDSLIIFEASLETDISYLEDLGFTVERVKQYKTNQHIFVKHK